MKNFIINLYSNENFPVYLGIFIVILLGAFLVIFFLGKKDQKLIETQKLKKIELENDKDKPSKENYEDDHEKVFDLEDQYVKDVKYDDAFAQEELIDTLELELPKVKKAYKPENINFEYTKTLELPRLNKDDKKLKNVRIEDFASLADSISDELDQIEKMQKKRDNLEYSESIYEEDTLELDLPKLKR